MRIYLLCLMPLAALAPGPGCKSVVCGDGTIERDGACVQADETVSEARCGAFTTLVAGVCTPIFEPTVCDDSTTLRDVDPETGVTTCIGTGTSSCGAPIACPPAAAGTQTICGQLYDFESGMPFAAPGAMGERCTAPAGSGPCSVGIRAYDAIAFGMNPMAAQPLAVGDTYIDDCGRYRLSDITPPAGPFIGLGIDDAMQGPMGTTNTVGVSTDKNVGGTTRNLEAFVVPSSTTTAWASSGGPPITGGIYAMVFRAARTGAATRANVTMTRGGSPLPGNDFYFASGQTTRTTIDPAATATGVNGTVLVTGAAVADGVAYSGASPDLPPQCQYKLHAGVSLPFIVFIQIFRPTDVAGMTCPL